MLPKTVSHILFFSLMLFSTVQVAFAVDEEWVVRYNGPLRAKDYITAAVVDSSGSQILGGYTYGRNYYDRSEYLVLKFDSAGAFVWSAVLGDGPETHITSMAVDGNDDIYVTGIVGGFDYLTAKLSSDGTLLWSDVFVTGTFDCPPGFFDCFPSSIAVDAAGNAYVVGSLENGSRGLDYVLIKYRENGIQDWVVTYNGIGNALDQGTAVNVDQSGNVYISGWSDGESGGRNLDTLMYDSSGSLQWVASYDSPFGYEDEATALVIDDSGNTYVAGKTYDLLSGPFYDYNFLTLKYDTSGNLLWSQETAQGGQPGSIALDSTGAVLVSGGAGFTTVKYDPLGTLLWSADYDGPGAGIDIAHDLVVDKDDNVIVVGETPGVTSGYDVTTVKYDSEGQQLWAARYEGIGDSIDSARAVEVDESGTVYTAAWMTDSAYNIDAIALQYSSSGVEISATPYDSPGNGDDRFVDMVVDANGSVYVIGNSEGEGIGEEFLTAKYDSLGNELWVNRYDGEGIVDPVEVTAMAVDAEGNTYVTGRVEVSVFNEDLIVLKYDTLGNKEWVVFYDGPESRDDEGLGIVVDGQGEVIVTGVSFSSSTNKDIVVLKYSSFGIKLWEASYNNPSSNWEDIPVGLRCTSGGGVVVLGTTKVLGSIDDDVITLQYDVGGNLEWSDIYGGASAGRDLAVDIELDVDDNVLVAATIQEDSGTNNDFATIKYDSLGNRLWDVRYNGLSGQNNDIAHALTVDDLGNVYLTGESNSFFTTVKYDPTGTELWSDQYKHTLSGRNVARDIVVDAYGTVYVAGDSGNDDFLMVQYDSHGTRTLSQVYNGTGDGLDRVARVALNEDTGSLLLAGYSYGGRTYLDATIVSYSQIWPSFRLDVAPEPLIPGQFASVSISGAEPFSPVYLVYSLEGAQSTYISQLDFNIELSQPALLAEPEITDFFGNASWVFSVPGGAAGLDVWFQAVQFGGKSEVVAATVENN